MLDVKNQIDEILDQYPAFIEKAPEKHTMILKSKFNGKLKPMKEKIDNLE